MSLSPQLVALLDQQHGAISRRQLLEAGVHPGKVDALVRCGHLEPVERGVYRRSGSGGGAAQQEVVAILRAGSGARLSGARLLGQLGVEGVATDAAFLVLVPPGRSPRGTGLQLRSDQAPELHRARYGAVPGTTPARTLVEIAANRRGVASTPPFTLDDEELLALFDRMRWRGVVTRRRLETTLRDLPRHRGAQRLRRLLELTASVVESPGERRLDAALVGLEPPLEWQVWVAPDLRVDALWRDASLVIEYQGGRTHEDPRDRASDARRHERLRALGYEVVVVDRNDLRDPEALRTRLLAARARRLQSLRCEKSAT